MSIRSEFPGLAKAFPATADAIQRYEDMPKTWTDEGFLTLPPEVENGDPWIADNLRLHLPALDTNGAP